MTAITSSSAPITTTSARWATPVHIAGAAMLGLIGLAHLLVVHAFGGADTPEEEVINDLSARTTTSMFEGGRQLSAFGLNTGYSVAMGLLAMLFGALVISAVRAAPQLIARWSLFNGICVAAAGGAFWIALLYFPEPAVALSGLATLCFAAVFVAGNRVEQHGQRPSSS
ncbi:LIC_13387 family protein [Nocardia sp. KC 131]|uniref:LIC_13387 family protein n=1 Tax=Nocardia arseniciresistens TaxID=3392119 RepID=UPI00398F25DB